jgi:hypothetical protein
MELPPVFRSDMNVKYGGLRSVDRPWRCSTVARAGSYAAGRGDVPRSALTCSNRKQLDIG